MSNLSHIGVIIFHLILFVLRFYGPVNGVMSSDYDTCIYIFGELFVCVEVLRPSQPNWVMSSAVSLPNHTFTGQA